MSYICITVGFFFIKIINTFVFIWFPFVPFCALKIMVIIMVKIKQKVKKLTPALIAQPTVDLSRATSYRG